MRVSIRTLSASEINKAIKKLEAYNKWVNKKSIELSKELANIGLQTASIAFASTPYVSPGERDAQVSVVKRKNKFVIVASGKDVAFIEFGAGAMMGYGYPSDVQLDPPTEIGPGTWSDSELGKGHWNDVMGWFFPDENGKTLHSFGNHPGMGMYNAGKDIRSEIERVARKAFETND